MFSDILQWVRAWEIETYGTLGDRVSHPPTKLEILRYFNLPPLQKLNLPPPDQRSCHEDLNLPRHRT